MSFVGHVCNFNGCWILTSNISAEAGASLPITSTMLGVPGMASGEWMVAYNGPAGQKGNWQSQITAGEIVVFVTSSYSGHITTVVSGSGGSAMVVDNIAYENQNNQITNSANDGAWDIIIAPPHPASYEWGLAVAGSVVVYELDCPIIRIITPTSRVAAGASEQLTPLFIASNPVAARRSPNISSTTPELAVQPMTDFWSMVPISSPTPRRMPSPSMPPTSRP